MGLLSAIFGESIKAGDVKVGFVLDDQPAIRNATVTEVEERSSGVIIHMGNNRVDHCIVRGYSQLVGVRYGYGEYDIEIDESSGRTGEYDIVIEDCCE